MTAFWSDWVDLPWELGADPRHGKAACCFRTAQAAREELGLGWPASRMERWYDMAQRGAWAALRADWDLLTIPAVGGFRPGLLLRFDAPDGSFGLGVTVDSSFFLTAKHRERLCAFNKTLCADKLLFDLRQ